MWFLNKFCPALPYAVNRLLILKIIGARLANSPVAPVYDPQKRLVYALASSYPYHISGYAVRSHEVLTRLKKSDRDVLAFTRCGYPWDRADARAAPLADYCEVDGVRYDHSKTPNKFRLLASYAPKAAKILADYARRNKVGVIHAPSNHVNALPALLAARSLGLPFQYEMRGLWELSRASRQPEYADSPGYRLGLELEAFVAANADRVFVISRPLGEYIAAEWGVDPAKISLLPNCVDAEKFTPAETCEGRGLVYAGSLVEYEGLDVLLEALAILRDDNFKLELDIIGDGESGPKLRELTREKRLGDRVNFLGSMTPDEARAKVAKSSLVCLPRKPYKVCELIPPIKLVEAMAFARPALVPDLPVFRDELGELADGWTFKPGDPADLARALKRAATNREAREAYGRKSRERVLRSRRWSDYVFDIFPWKN